LRTASAGDARITARFAEPPVQVKQNYPIGVEEVRGEEINFGSEQKRNFLFLFEKDVKYDMRIMHWYDRM
jgi:hypothetical protein